MADVGKTFLLELLKENGNSECADCGCKDPEWASCTLGIFLCQDCAGIHRSLSTGVSRIKSIHLDRWENEQLQLMKKIGNVKAKQVYEKYVPPFYKKPKVTDPGVLKTEWIYAKYKRFEFDDPQHQNEYLKETKEGILMKRGKENQKFKPRRFLLSRSENLLKYFNKENASRPKAEINLDSLNAVFVPEKIGQLNGLQITYTDRGSTRCIYVYHQDSKEIVDWYQSIRALKLERRKIAFPDKNVSELCEDLTRSFSKEGWLSKKGPRDEPFRKRWFTFDRRKLMYFEEPLNAFAKGEIFIGHKDNCYSIVEGIPADGRTAPGYGFTLHTPDRDFYLSADSKAEMEEWIHELTKVTLTPLTPQDNKIAASMVNKRPTTIYQMMKR
ncbi:arf-GAP with dual PH domain-containing protein 1 [Octopus bimaculoides]|nr:arf-GAP with dual PH domain-containing protein 1 [Octopus bimaculoides]|eukprot:XP_014789162.1 PREDICTED: arf-GAP with dual PH domain-containing protein 1-like [Octopus bimaculoides]